MKGIFLERESKETLLGLSFPASSNDTTAWHYFKRWISAAILPVHIVDHGGNLYLEIEREGFQGLMEGARLGAGRYTLMQELGRGAMGTFWLATDNDLVILREAGTGKIALKLQGHTDSVGNVGFSEDGGWIYTGAADDTVRMWK